MKCKKGDGSCENRTLFKHQNSRIHKSKRKDQEAKDLDLWSCSWLLHHDNAFVHNVILVGRILARNEYQHSNMVCTHILPHQTQLKSSLIWTHEHIYKKSQNTNAQSMFMYNTFHSIDHTVAASRATVYSIILKFHEILSLLDTEGTWKWHVLTKEQTDVMVLEKKQTQTCCYVCRFFTLNDLVNNHLIHPLNILLFLSASENISEEFENVLHINSLNMSW